jgi:hypothetical protein
MMKIVNLMAIKRRHQVLVFSLLIRRTRRHQKTLKNKRNKILKSVECLDDSDDNFERPTIDEQIKEYISFEK